MAARYASKPIGACVLYVHPLRTYQLKYMGGGGGLWYGIFVLEITSCFKEEKKSPLQQGLDRGPCQYLYTV